METDKPNESNEDHPGVWVPYNVMCKEGVRWSFSLQEKIALSACEGLLEPEREPVSGRW